jgi:glyoxylase-like metal-dependent hydrolase (beta-lactamase superfamily II)
MKKYYFKRLVLSYIPIMNQLPTIIDCQYLEPRFAASYLIQEKDEAVFIDNNTTHSVPLLMKALQEQGLHPHQVKYLIITHVHLDHAGGSSALMKECPNAILLAHPKAAIHVIDPSRLVASAKGVYGEASFNQLYGEITPISSDRVKSVEDEETLALGNRTFRFFYTRGHANHHICIYDSLSKSVFTGDSFGLAYPDLQDNGLFIFPSTSPTDFDPTEAKLSIQKILNTGAERAYLTHFGAVTDLKEAARQLNLHLNFSEELLNRAIQKKEIGVELTQFCESELRSYFKTVLEDHHLSNHARVWSLIKLDLELNAAGIAFQAQKRRIQT